MTGTFILGSSITLLFMVFFLGAVIVGAKEDPASFVSIGILIVLVFAILGSHLVDSTAGLTPEPSADLEFAVGPTFL